MNEALKCKMLKDMIRIRTFEEELQKLVKADEMTGFLHLYIGEEAIAVGVCNAINKDDYITSTHRGHGHMIAKGIPTRDMMAELFGKASGCNKGRGGSMHICVPSMGIIGTNGIVGAGLPLAVGAGFTAMYTNDDRISVCFFGDGASNEGSFHESINMAAIWKLPVIFVCENNLYACNTKISDTCNTPNVADRAKGYGIPGEVIDGNDVEKVYTSMQKAVEYVRAGNGPMLIEYKTYRRLEHCLGDPDLRAPEEKDNWAKIEPINRYADKLVSVGVIDQGTVDSYWTGALKEISDAIAYGRSEPEPSIETLLIDVYGE
jgi:TPP-dependent pyruvate/acetoin dehydrogenase alpha subunit